MLQSLLPLRFSPFSRKLKSARTKGDLKSLCSICRNVSKNNEHFFFTNAIKCSNIKVS